MNIAYETVDRHLGTELGDAPALRCLGEIGERSVLTFTELATSSSRFANVLRDLGARRGDRIATVLGRGPSSYTVMLGAWKAGCVAVPLRAAMDSGPLAERLAHCGARVLVTTADRYRHTLAGHRRVLPDLRHILLADDEGESLPNTIGLSCALSGVDAEFPLADMRSEDPAYLLFDRGVTGGPRAAVHVHGSVLANRASAQLVLGINSRDIYWCTADLATITGVAYGLIAPLSLGATAVVDGAPLDAGRCYRILTREQVGIWHTDPSILNMLRRNGEPPPGTELSGLRLVASTGAPLDLETVIWTRRVLGHAAHDNWSQAETGGIMIAEPAAGHIRPGAMGRPLPGIGAVALRLGADGHVALDDDGEVVQAATDEVGELALRAGWPSMFRGYWSDPGRYTDSFVDGWYLTGDLVRRDAAGRFRAAGRVCRDDPGPAVGTSGNRSAG